ncbi:MAG: IS200/IS605 family transposase [Lachnospiraceae bacterium]|nr:IS200/IS605 family transposase [Lachnospiraceae bacterium]
MNHLDDNKHSVFLLKYRLILTTMQRRAVIDGEISRRLKEFFITNADSYNVSLEEWDAHEDHIYIRFRAHPNSELKKFLNAYKSASSRLIKKEHPEIVEQLWEGMFWSKSFYMVTEGQSMAGDEAAYLEKQKERVIRKRNRRGRRQEVS